MAKTMSCRSMSAMYRRWLALFGVMVFLPKARGRPVSRMPRSEMPGSSVATRSSALTSPLSSTRPSRTNWLYSSRMRTALFTCAGSPSMARWLSCNCVVTCRADSRNFRFSSRVPKSGSIPPAMGTVRRMEFLAPRLSPGGPGISTSPEGAESLAKQGTLAGWLGQAGPAKPLISNKIQRDSRRDTCSSPASALRSGELHLGGLTGGRRGCEISLVTLEAGPTGEQAVGEQADKGVVVRQSFVVAPPLGGNAVFCACQLILQAQKILVGLELRVVFDDHQQATQRAVELIIGGDALGRRAGAEQGRTRIGDVAKHGLLLRGDALYRLHEVRDQVGAPLEYNVHLRPGGFDRLVLADHLVAPVEVHSADQERHNHQHRDNRQQHVLHSFPPRRTLTYAMRRVCVSTAPASTPAREPYQQARIRRVSTKTSPMPGGGPLPQPRESPPRDRRQRSPARRLSGAAACPRERRAPHASRRHQSPEAMPADPPRRACPAAARRPAQSTRGETALQMLKPKRSSAAPSSHHFAPWRESPGAGAPGWCAARVPPARGAGSWARGARRRRLRPRARAGWPEYPATR